MKYPTPCGSHVVRALASSANSPSLATTNCLPGDTWRVSFGRWANPCGSLKVLGNSPGDLPRYHDRNARVYRRTNIEWTQLGTGLQG